MTRALTCGPPFLLPRRQVTHDGGNTWIFETPNNLLVSGTNYPTAMTTMANVPSNY